MKSTIWLCWVCDEVIKLTTPRITVYSSLTQYLVLIPLVFSAVSPLRKANDDGLRPTFAAATMVSHCSAVAKLGK